MPWKNVSTADRNIARPRCERAISSASMPPSTKAPARPARMRACRQHVGEQRSSDEKISISARRSPAPTGNRKCGKNSEAICQTSDQPRTNGSAERLGAACRRQHLRRMRATCRGRHRSFHRRLIDRRRRQRSLKQEADRRRPCRPPRSAWRLRRPAARSCRAGHWRGSESAIASGRRRCPSRRDQLRASSGCAIDPFGGFLVGRVELRHQLRVLLDPVVMRGDAEIGDVAAAGEALPRFRRCRGRCVRMSGFFGLQQRYRPAPTAAPRRRGRPARSRPGRASRYSPPENFADRRPAASRTSRTST